MNNWNGIKYRILKYMDYRHETGLYKPLTAWQLAQITGIGLHSAHTLLPKYAKKFRYISRIRPKTKAESTYYYGGTIVQVSFKYHLILQKGQDWLVWFERNYPKLAEVYFDDLQQHLERRRGETYEARSGRIKVS